MTLEQQVSTVATKLDMFIAESREARKRQDDDMREMRSDMRDMRNEMKTIQLNLDSKIDSMGKHVRNMSIVAMIGIAAMVVAVFLK